MWHKTPRKLLCVLTLMSLALVVCYYSFLTSNDRLYISVTHSRKIENVSNKSSTEKRNGETTTKTKPSNMQNIPFSPFLEICSNMTWRPDLILLSSSSWEPIVPGQSYVYSVFLDERMKLKEIKAITVITGKYIQNISIFCQIWSKNEKHPIVVKPTFFNIPYGNVDSR